MGGRLVDVGRLDADDPGVHAVVPVHSGLAVADGLEAEAAGAVAVAEEFLLAHCDGCVKTCGAGCCGKKKRGRGGVVMRVGMVEG